ncbi:hypothetical protein [Paenibacillus eucommiae]|uniref:DUF3887 domain-containing protein n=1 Tax=Paenibacillus eucommiae TaxID=1355755 RepID=A0ABS4IPX1_9BACL|nr:hypothetical protein [Paenibacillus eucommiae]MBP1989610.1 hypothetical protein [Paenibacillus eucommiae]
MKLLVRSLLILTVITIGLSFVQAVHASDGAEVFDIKRGEIVQRIQNSQLLQSQVKEWLSSAIGIARSFNIEPNDGLAIKIPVTPPYSIHHELVNGTVTEVVMFIGRSSTYFPTLLIFTKENNFIAVHIANHQLKDFLEENKLYTPELNLSEPVLH